MQSIHLGTSLVKERSTIPALTHLVNGKEMCEKNNALVGYERAFVLGAADDVWLREGKFHGFPDNIEVVGANFVTTARYTNISAACLFPRQSEARAPLTRGEVVHGSALRARQRACHLRHVVLLCIANILPRV